MAEETAKEREPQKEHFEGEFERFNDAECSADGRVYAKEGELYIPELGVVCYGNGPCGKPSQELDTATPCYHTAFIKTSEGKVYARKDYKDVKKLKEFFDSHGKTLRKMHNNKQMQSLKERLSANDAYSTKIPEGREEHIESKNPAGPYNETIGVYSAPKAEAPKQNPSLESEVERAPVKENILEKGVKRNGKVVEYPNNGTLFVATDLHGDMGSLEEVISAFEKKHAENAKTGKHTYLLTLGDDIHKDPEDYEIKNGLEYDDSYKALDRLEELRTKYGKYAVISLMGNHEIAHLGIKELQYAVKYNVDQTKPFKRAVRRSKGDEAMGKYIEQIRERPLMAQIQNGILFSHTGPFFGGKKKDVCEAEYSEKCMAILEGFLTRRIHEGFSLTIDEYLEEEKSYTSAGDTMRAAFGANLLVLGHTPPSKRFFMEHPKANTRMGNGYISLKNNMFIFTTGKQRECAGNCFLELDLGRPIANVAELEKRGAIKRCTS